MKKMIFIIIICFVIIPCLFSNNEWKYEKTRKGIKLYSKKLNKTDIRMFKGVTIVDSGIEVLSEVLKRPSSYALFLYRCKVSKMIKKYSEYEIMAYNLSDLPWPIKDREIVVRSSLIEDFEKGIFTITIKSIPLQQHEKFIKPNKKFKIMKDAISIFVLKIIDRNTTEVTFMAYADPGGISADLVNYDSSKIPYKSLLKLKKLVKEKNFIEIAEKAKKIPELENFFFKLEKKTKKQK